MRTETRILYCFDELSSGAQDKAIEKFWDINVDYAWWEFVCEDAEQAGIEITELDVERSSIKGKLTESMVYSIDAIRREHGPTCETFKIAGNYKKAFDELLAKDNLLLENERNGHELQGQIADLAEEFCRDILEEYLVMLRQEYEGLTSRESIIKAINTNKYEFDENGNFVPVKIIAV